MNGDNIISNNHFPHFLSKQPIDGKLWQLLSYYDIYNIVCNKSRCTPIVFYSASDAGVALISWEAINYTSSTNHAHNMELGEFNANSCAPYLLCGIYSTLELNALPSSDHYEAKGEKAQSKIRNIYPMTEYRSVFACLVSGLSLTTLQCFKDRDVSMKMRQIKLVGL